jgi:hypothetical protein
MGFKIDTEWNWNVDLTLNIKNFEEAFYIGNDEKVSKSRIKLTENPRKQGPVEFKITFPLLSRVEAIQIRYFESWYSDKNAVLTEILVYGAKSGQFSSTALDHRGRYLTVSSDSVLRAVPPPPSLQPQDTLDQGSDIPFLYIYGPFFQTSDASY